jgi:hypothetical protein
MWLLWASTMLLLLVMGRRRASGAQEGPSALVFNDAGKYISPAFEWLHVPAVYSVFTLYVSLSRLGRVTPSWLRCEDILLITKRFP